MKKLNFYFNLFLITVDCSICTNTTHATIAIGEVDISKLKPGDDVMVPVKLVEKSGGLIAGFQLFIMDLIIHYSIGREPLIITLSWC